jgi:hypothetical protein
MSPRSLFLLPAFSRASLDDLMDLVGDHRLD